MTLSRRSFLARSAAVGCSTAASPLLTPMTFAAAPMEARLVVILLRGGMDGLDVVQPYGDPAYAALRPTLVGGPQSGAVDLNGFYALHPALAPLLPMWRSGELGFVQAVSTPYRGKRSHFDGQDLLEAGTIALGEARGGWLNRLLAVLPGSAARSAFAIGHGEMKLLQGDAPYSSWSPDASLLLSPQAERLAGLLMEDDLLFHGALSGALERSRGGRQLLPDGLETDDSVGAMMGMPRPSRGKSHQKNAEFAAEQLRGDARIAAFSLNGWDTHNRQKQGLNRALDRLSDTLLALQSGVGPAIWQKTAVVALTEFGRTVRENGTGGTDHGTGGTMLIAGGAVRGGKVHGRWPGLQEADLHERRDLMPTTDVRAQLAWILHGLTSVGADALTGTVFPGARMGHDPGLLR